MVYVNWTTDYETDNVMYHTISPSQYIRVYAIGRVCNATLLDVSLYYTMVPNCVVVFCCSNQ